MGVHVDVESQLLWSVALVLVLMCAPCAWLHAARYVERSMLPGLRTSIVRLVVAAGAVVFPVALLVLASSSLSRLVGDSWAVPVWAVAAVVAGAFAYGIWEAGRWRIPPAPRFASLAQQREVQRLEGTGFEVDLTRADGSITMIRRARRYSFTPDERAHVGPDGEHAPTFSPYLSLMVMGPVFVAVAYGWWALAVALLVASLYVWWEWGRYREQKSPPETSDRGRTRA